MWLAGHLCTLKDACSGITTSLRTFASFLNSDDGLTTHSIVDHVRLATLSTRSTCTPYCRVFILMESFYSQSERTGTHYVDNADSLSVITVHYSLYTATWANLWLYSYILNIGMFVDISNNPCTYELLRALSSPPKRICWVNIRILIPHRINKSIKKIK